MAKFYIDTVLAQQETLIIEVNLSKIATDEEKNNLLSCLLILSHHMVYAYKNPDKPVSRNFLDQDLGPILE